MLTSITKFSKSFFVKLLVGIIILPFVFWGMGDVFRGGSQNIVAKIDSDKISAQEFANYLKRLSFTDEERKNISKTNLLEEVLSDYIGKRIIALEIQSLGIELTDSSLKNIITNDKLFFKDGNFSRTEYEKFLIKSGISAPTFEQNIAEQEKRRQLLSYLSNGLSIPNFIVQSEYNKENQVKKIKYINLNKYYQNIKIQDKELKDVYQKNKSFFVEEFKNINLVELTPQNLTGKNIFDDSYFKIIDKIENNILDGQASKIIFNQYNLTALKVKEINNKKITSDGKKYNEIDEDLFKEIYKIKNTNSPKIINLNNKYYLVEITAIIKKEKSLNDKDVSNLITKQIKLKEKIVNNTKIANEIISGKFNKNDMQKFAKENNLEIKSAEIKSLKDNSIFTESLIRKIFQTPNNKLNIVADTKLSKNFIIFVDNTEFKKIKNNSAEFKKYASKAKLNFSREIFSIYDNSVNTKYKITINSKTVDRIKNSF